MKSAPNASAAIVTAITLGLFVLPAIPSHLTYHAAVLDRLPASAVAPTSHTLPIASGSAAYFKVGFPPEDVTFTILLTDIVKAQHARDIVNGTKTDRVSVMGTVVKAPAWYNPGWTYHLDPGSIEFFDFAVEVCDANPQYVEQHLEEACGAFLPGCVWCPFSSVVTEEVHTFERFLPIIAT